MLGYCLHQRRLRECKRCAGDSRENAGKNQRVSSPDECRSLGTGAHESAGWE
jgi:hypothetical protein